MRPLHLLYPLERALSRFFICPQELYSPFIKWKWNFFFLVLTFQPVHLRFLDQCTLERRTQERNSPFIPLRLKAALQFYKKEDHRLVLVCRLVMAVCNN